MQSDEQHICSILHTKEKILKGFDPFEAVLGSREPGKQKMIQSKINQVEKILFQRMIFLDRNLVKLQMMTSSLFHGKQLRYFVFRMMMKTAFVVKNRLCDAKLEGSVTVVKKVT